jgi:hypothetical protein
MHEISALWDYRIQFNMNYPVGTTAFNSIPVGTTDLL